VVTTAGLSGCDFDLGDYFTVSGDSRKFARTCAALKGQSVSAEGNPVFTFEPLADKWVNLGLDLVCVRHNGGSSKSLLHFGDCWFELSFSPDQIDAGAKPPSLRI
jgi:hypothetical protein